MNPYTGDMPVDIDGERLTLSYNWAALARIRAELGLDGQARALSGDLDKLATLIAIGLACHHPDWTPHRIKEASPPYYPTIKAVEDALLAAYHGINGVPKEPEKNPPKPSRILSKWLCRRLLGQE